MLCPKCGVSNPENNNFCQSCGVSLAVSAVPPPQPVVPPSPTPVQTAPQQSSAPPSVSPPVEQPITPTTSTPAKKGKNASHWFLWWQLDPDELHKQVEGYQSLKIHQSAKGQSLLLLIFSAAMNTALILFSILDSFVFLDVFLFLVLGFFIYQGHKWAMMGAMILWTLEKLLSLLEVNPIISLIWWAVYMHAFYLAFKVENLRANLKARGA